MSSRAADLYKEVRSEAFPFYANWQRAMLVQRVRTEARKLNPIAAIGSPDYFDMLYLDVVAVKLDIHIDFGESNT